MSTRNSSRIKGEGLKESQPSKPILRKAKSELINCCQTSSQASSQNQKNELIETPVQGRISNYKFISKLVEILSYEQIGPIVSWSQDGTIIEIKDERKFIDEVLPMFFKHNNMSNFIRQLNMYNFKKVKHYPISGIAAYKNPFFKRENNTLIAEINRKNPSSKLNEVEYPNCGSGSELKIKSETTPDVLLETKENSSIRNVNYLFKKLQGLEQKVAHLEKTNESLVDYNTEFSRSILSKAEYIKRLESLIYYIIHHVLPANVLHSESSLEKLKSLNYSKALGFNPSEKKLGKNGNQSQNVNDLTDLQEEIGVEGEQSDDLASLHNHIINDIQQGNDIQLVGTKRKLQNIQQVPRLSHPDANEQKNDGFFKDLILKFREYDNSCTRAKTVKSKEDFEDTIDEMEYSKVGDNRRFEIPNSNQDTQFNNYSEKDSKKNQTSTGPQTSSSRILDSDFNNFLIKKINSFNSANTTDNLFDKNALYQNSNLSSSNPFNLTAGAISSFDLYNKPQFQRPSKPQPPVDPKKKSSTTDLYFVSIDGAEDEEKRKRSESQ